MDSSPGPAATPSWVREFYDRKSRAAGPSGVLDHHVERAEALVRLGGPGRRTVLELGAGTGGSAVAAARLGLEVTAVELSGVRAGLARDLARDEGVDLTVVEGDFLEHDIGAGFDLVVMWNGFGVGDDAHQRAILARAASTWLAADGLVVLDVFNPAAWIRWAGHDEVDEETGCHETLDYDVVGSRFLDAWWFDGPDAPPLTQSVRCYSPADLDLLVEGTGLAVTALELGDGPLTDRSAAGPASEAWGYRAVLARVAGR
ncbi:class I SAM-dependent methyltransferase [Microbacterium sp. ARD31]|uniref:SAM-dependent methyltransferase n=1 Tax=Microbacterium sp. ARD31 TaxID=2962576 RepID=UPI002881E364|nr:class I SAM-dependent methyltransferase [Microbacterium sp. ARD31]MDT0184978.1 class I SAM-dependent methyltransferase [Microbacterium sp. ARD31]